MITERIEGARQNYINSKPAVSYERARIWTESHKKNEGEAVPIRRAKAFRDTCQQIDVNIFDGELIVGVIGEFRKCGILTPEFSWTWVDREMDNFDKRVQDPYVMTDEQRDYVRKNIFPYWKGKSLEEAFLAQLPAETAKVAVDTGFVDNDSKWRQAVGEITPDYQDVLFKKGFGGIIREAKEHLSKLSRTSAEDLKKKDFYNSIIITSEGIITLAKRYSEKAMEMAALEKDAARKAELLKISDICSRIPENTPASFYEAIQFLWFMQIGGILSENPLALNVGRFDQFMYPYYKADIEKGIMTKDQIQELIEALWLKLSEWVWTISANTAEFFAGYNQFQNLTVGGKTREGKDATNDLSYMCLNATEAVKTHQPGLSVRIHQDCPTEFLDAVTHLVSKGTGFPAIHSDSAGYQMLINAGYEPEDARDWNNCGCVVPHFRKTYEWTSAVNINFTAALEFALNQGKSRISGDRIGLDEKAPADFKTYEEVEAAFYRQFDNLIEQSIIATLLAQKLHKEMVPRPFLSSCIEECMTSGKDLVDVGAKYNLGPVLTGIGLAVTSNSLAVIKKLVFEDKAVDMETLIKALDANWEGYEELRQVAFTVPKYGNDNDYVDDIACKMANHYYKEGHKYKDINGNNFNTAFMGISNYLPTGKVIGATPCGRKAKEPLSEGVSPFAGSDTSSPLAAMRSAAKLNQDVHSGGTLLNLRLNEDLVSTKRGRSNLGAMIQTFFSLGAFHVQFNTISTETLRKAQKNPENYKDLLIRVAGYSTQFVNLSRSMQDAIIARTAHENY
ncbi:formate C-acetyltransferase/glycerol dehydratase family glycyl radical enzyme [Desulfosporosinus sp. BICA1-9]|uniref:glycyl radical protein n=1 Tax=Desulfosporosinus sp. BICA1-9 TaxID=1531958 RepID=UPI00054B1CFB|nr:formate C-acetyltransferase/glycerol dehydratase family glycyl radical enzyme [Desulfosporosinus sp. BICA1-9]KJS80062.1 MAG: dehydrogenase [Desulfosporosinus sp. BICA1-9]HBW38614.1 formate C-acetyltransferase/glycerol dehydratase family glycyl radical enzyme [Desulfosporosinus sp.]